MIQTTTTTTTTISRRRLIPSGSGRQALWKIRTKDMLYGGVVLSLTWLLLVWTRLRQVVTLPPPVAAAAAAAEQQQQQQQPDGTVASSEESSESSSSSSFTLSLVPWRQDLKHAPGIQYTLSFRRPNGQWKNPIKSFHRIAVQDLHDLPLHSLHEYIHKNNKTNNNNKNNNQDDDLSQKDYILDLLAATGITEIERPVVQALPTWKRFAEQYGNDEAPIVVGTEACPTLLLRNNNNNNNTHTNHPTAMYVGVAGMFNTGTTTLDLYLRENLVLPTPTWFDDDQQQQQQHKAFNQGVPWGKHRLWSLRHDFMPLTTTTTTTTTRTTNGANQNAMVDQVLPIVIIRDPFTWMQSMCSSPYKAAWPHDMTIHCPNLVASHEDVVMAMGSNNNHNHNVTTVGQFIPTVLTAQKQRKFETLLDLWIEWYTEYLTSDKPRLLVRFEDLLIRPDAVVKEIQSCLQLPSKQQRQQEQQQRDDNDNKFVYVVGAMKWDQKYVKKQSSMVSAIIKYGHGWDRFRNMTAADLEVARQKLSTGPGRTLSQLFHYHYTDVWPEDKDAS